VTDGRTDAQTAADKHDVIPMRRLTVFTGTPNLARYVKQEDDHALS